MNISLDKVCDLIERARALDVKEQDSDPDSGSNATDDRMVDVLTADAEDDTEGEIRRFVHGLNVEERHDLVALAWVGRGDFDPSEWPDAVANAAERERGDTAEYLLGIPNLADLLDEGLAALGRSCAERDFTDQAREAG